MKKRVFTLVLAVLTAAALLAAPALAAPEPEITWIDGVELDPGLERLMSVDYIPEMDILVFLQRSLETGDKYVMYRPGTGEVVTDPEYNCIEHFTDGLAIAYKVETDGNGRGGDAVYGVSRKGYIDATGKVVIPVKYDYAYCFDGGYAVAGYYDKGWYIIDKQGNETALDYSPIQDNAYGPYLGGFSDGLLAVNQGEFMDTKYGFVDTSGNIVVPIVYDSVSRRFTEGLAFGEAGGKCYLLDTSGDRVLCLTDTFPGVQSLWSLGEFHDGLARVRIDGKYGYIDTHGELVIKPIYDEAGDFSGGRARVGLGENYPTREYYYIDRSGATVPVTELVTTYSDEGLAGLEYSDGTAVLPEEYRQIIVADKYIVVATRENRVGIMKNPLYVQTWDVSDMTDVRPGDWFYPYVEWGLAKGIAAPAAGDAFEPDAGCPRSEVVMMLWRAAGMPEPESGENPFPDVKETDEYYKAVLWANAKGITTGSDGKFLPDESVTRAQAVTFLHRAAGLPPVPEGDETFPDIAPVLPWAGDAILWAARTKPFITNGGANGFDPMGEVTRAQMITFIYRWMNK